MFGKEAESEVKIKARSASSAAACPVEQRREPRSGGKPGSPFLWLLYFGEAKESSLLPGYPRRF